MTARTRNWGGEGRGGKGVDGGRSFFLLFCHFCKVREELCKAFVVENVVCNTHVPKPKQNKQAYTCTRVRERERVQVRVRVRVQVRARK